MTRRHAVLGAAFALALWLALFGDKTPVERAAVAVVMPTGPVGVPDREQAAMKEVLHRAGDTGIRDPLVDRSTWVDEGFVLRLHEPFGRRAPLTLTETAPVQPTPDPEAISQALPQRSYTVLGKQYDGKHWAVYLGREERVWVVREGGSFDGDHWVQSIRPPAMTVVHQPSGSMMKLQIGAGL